MLTTYSDIFYLNLSNVMMMIFGTLGHYPSIFHGCILKYHEIIIFLKSIHFFLQFDYDITLNNDILFLIP